MSCFCDGSCMVTGKCHKQITPSPVYKPVDYGWICPRCDRVNAPYVSKCPCRGFNSWYTDPTSNERNNFGD